MSLAGEAVVSIWHDIAPEGRDAFYAWHVHEHIPERVGIPGFTRGRRYIAEWGAPQFFTLYEVQTVETLAGQDYQNRLNNPTPWTLSTVKHFQNVARSTQRVRYSAGPGIGGHLLTLQLEVDDNASFVEQLSAQVLVPVTAVHGICGVHLCQTDVAISTTPTKEKEARAGGTSVPGWALLVEGASRTVVERVRNDLVTDAALRRAGAGEQISAALYRLEYVRTKTATTA